MNHLMIFIKITEFRENNFIIRDFNILFKNLTAENFNVRITAIARL